jgi:hypothetical protein
MRPEADLDIECFHNWFLVGITDKVNGWQWDFQMVPGTLLDTDSIRQLCLHYTMVTFNGTHYDWPMLMLALAGADCATLKRANDWIIEGRTKCWQFYRETGCWPPAEFDHIDVAEPTPGVKVSLKQYACRMHWPLVQDSPVDFRLPLPLWKVPEEIAYCRNDRGITRQIREEIKERMDLRVRMGERFGVDLRSKSDAQMAEAMVKAEWCRLMQESMRTNGWWHNGLQFKQDRYGNVTAPVIPKYPHGHRFRATIPDYIGFATPEMNRVLDLVRQCEFVVSDKEQAVEWGYDPTGIKTGVIMPDELKGLDIPIGQSVYRMGIGGIHSQEASVTYRSIPGVQTLKTADVTAYYPNLMVNARMNPAQLGPLFLMIYKGFKEEREDAKIKVKQHPHGSSEWAMLDAIDKGVKIVLNGTFGKLWSRFSIFYAPEFGVAVTIGGQLSLLMLIERLEMYGIRVVSANTDGIEILVPFGREADCDQIIKWWEHICNLQMETKNYLALHSRDVNSYISIGFDGKAKRKGRYGESGLLKNKHPDMDVCTDAVVEYLTKGKPLANHIVGCRDIRKFLKVRGAKGGARLASGGENLGRAVRWYYAAGSTDYIIDCASENKVGGTDGCRLAMSLPVDMPSDVDYPLYISTAEQMLAELGVT